MPITALNAGAKKNLEQSFPGFADGTFAFFRELAENNNTLWFDHNRERYERDVRQVFQSLLAALEPALLQLNPDFETAGKVNRNFSRINRDIRFRKDKSPYKLNYYLHVFDSRRDRQADGRLYVGLNAECLTVGFATYAAWSRKGSSALETVFRKRLPRERKLFQELLDAIVRAGRYETYWHRSEKNEWVLRPGLPRSEQDWGTIHAWVVRKVFPADMKSLSKPAFAGRIRGIFRELYPLYVFTSVEGARWRRELNKALPR
jgi:uncharacterized protein (TIGR02453 family)